MKKIILSILVILSLGINVYGQSYIESDCKNTGQNTQYNLYDIGNKKIYQIILPYNLFFGFANNPEKSYLENLYLKNYADVIEYSLGEKNTITAKMINGQQDYIDTSSDLTDDWGNTYIDLCDTFCDYISSDVISSSEDLLTDFLSKNNIHSEILGGCILTTNFQLMMHSIFCVLTTDDMYFIHTDGYDDISLYNSSEFKDKFSLKYEWGSFKYNNEDISSIKPIYIIDAPYISIRDFLEYMGCDVGWNEDSRELTFKYNDNEYQCEYNILSFVYNIDTKEKVFERTWTPAYPGLNINGKLYYEVSEVNLFAQKMFNKSLTKNDSGSKGIIQMQ